MSFGPLFKKNVASEQDLEKEFGRTWIWTALDAQTRLIVCFAIGDRTLEECRAFLKELALRLDGEKPLFTSDELPHYTDALLETFHNIESPEPTGKRGRPRSPKKTPQPDLVYATVHKTRVNGRVVHVRCNIIFGDQASVQERLEKSPSRKINTAYVERSNGILRQLDSHLRRKTLMFAKSMKFLRAKLALIIGIYNFCRPHATLSKNPDRTITPRTPAMVAGILKEPWEIGLLLAKPCINY